MRCPATALTAAVLAGAMAIAVAGCGGSDAPVASTAAGGSGGGPASVSATSGRIAPDAQKVIDSTPQPPACAPGGLPADTAQATCQVFWNHILMWHRGPDVATGPVLVGADPGSMEYLGYRGSGSAQPWWGPNLPTGCEGTGSIERNGGYCGYRKPGLEFGKSTMIEARSTAPEAKSTVTWYFEPGGTRLGSVDFMASSTGGEGGTQYAFCGERAAARDNPSLHDWVSCSRANPEHDGAIINAQKASPDARPAASFGWVIESYPVLVRVTNQVPDTALVRPRTGRSDGVRYSNAATMWGANPRPVHRLDGPRATAGGQGPSGAEASWWLAGYRTRTGTGATVYVTGQLVVVPPSGRAGTIGRPFTYSADLTDLAKAGGAPRTVECVGSGRTPRTGGKCLVRFSPGGPSVPAVVEVTLVPAAAA